MKQLIYLFTLFVVLIGGTVSVSADTSLPVKGYLGQENRGEVPPSTIEKPSMTQPPAKNPSKDKQLPQLGESRLFLITIGGIILCFIALWRLREKSKERLNQVTKGLKNIY